MRVLEPQRILEQSDRAKTRRTSTGTGDAIDHSRPFIHENFTQLYYTKFYPRLSHIQRLRYNQLFGARANELFMMFESGFTNRVIEKLADHPKVIGRPGLSKCLAVMLAEETLHHAMFLELNQRCFPELYSKRELFFSRLQWWENAALQLLTSVPQHLTFLVWLILILEEHSVALSLSLVRQHDTESLGEIEANVLETHIAHLRDEARHVHIDAHVIDLFLDGKCSFNRRLNGILFKRLFNEISAPKRSGVAVIRRLVFEFPELANWEGDMIRAVRDQKQDAGISQTLAHPANLPLTTALMSTYPEFQLSPLID